MDGELSVGLRRSRRYVPNLGSADFIIDIAGAKPLSELASGNAVFVSSIDVKCDRQSFGGWLFS
jgi:hypothetical protein